MATGGAGDVGDGAARVHNHRKGPGRGAQLQRGVEVPAAQTQARCQSSMGGFSSHTQYMCSQSARDKGAPLPGQPISLPAVSHEMWLNDAVQPLLLPAIPPAHGTKRHARCFDVSERVLLCNVVSDAAKSIS